MLKAIVFDYNGVLVDDLRIHEEAYWRAGREFGYPVARETVRQHLSTTPAEKRELYFGTIPDADWERIFAFKEELYFELTSQTNCLFPGVAQVLEALSRTHVLGLLSNTFRRHYERVFPPDLAAYFTHTLFSNEVAIPKPSPEPLRRMMDLLQVTPDTCCYVGDSLSDVRMAQAAGVKILTVATGDHSRQELSASGAEWVADSLLELATRIQNDDRF